jgi:23S rRNA (cytidine1920-2'-O)/16S rRNA (cytidine1409-2'-O)-methyltransferase
VLLTHGAAKVFAVDVGHGQLAWKLRSDPRVVLEKCNARTLDAETIPDPIDAGLRCQLHRPAHGPARRAGIVPPGAWAVALIKPQFEAGREAVGAKGGW